MLGPSLAGSPRVQAHRDYIIKVLLQGMSGPIAGKTYPDVMAPLGNTSSDEWVAGVASYVRSSFGNNAGMVTPADVARVRKETAGRKTPWTYPELEASLPRLLDAQQWKLTASHSADAAAGAPSLRGWSSARASSRGNVVLGGAGAAGDRYGMQFDSNLASGRGGRGGPTSAPVIGYPRATLCRYPLTVRAGARCRDGQRARACAPTITFAPARAKFVRITLTDPGADAPPWSVKNLRLYEAPPSSARK